MRDDVTAYLKPGGGGRATAAECERGARAGSERLRAARRLRGVGAPEPAALSQPGRTCAGERRGAAAAPRG